MRTQSQIVLKVIENGKIGPAFVPKFHYADQWWPNTNWPFAGGTLVPGVVHHTLTIYGDDLEEVYDMDSNAVNGIHRITGMRIKHEWSWNNGATGFTTDVPFDNSVALFGSFLNGEHHFMFRAWAAGGAEHNVEHAEYLEEPVPFPAHTGNHTIWSYHYGTLPCDEPPLPPGWPWCGPENPIARLNMNTGTGFARIYTKNGLDLNGVMRSSTEGLCQVKLAGPLRLKVNYKPKNNDGTPVEGKQAHVVVGRVTSQPGVNIEDGEYYEYVKTLPVPIEDEVIEYEQEIFHSKLVAYGSADDGPSGSHEEYWRNETFDKQVYSHLNFLQVVWRGEDLGLTPEPNAWKDITRVIASMRYADIRYHPAAGITDVVRSTINVQPEYELSPYPNWSMLFGGEIPPVGNQTTLTASGTQTFQLSHPNGFGYWDLRPYRYLAIPYISSTSVPVTIDLQWFAPGNQSGRKRYYGTFENTNGQVQTLWVDMRNPAMINLVPKANMPLLDITNQALTNFMPNNTGSNLHRFGGMANTSRVSLTFADATVTVERLKAKVKDSATLTPYQGSTTCVYGTVDYADAFRNGAFDLGGLIGGSQRIQGTAIDHTHSPNIVGAPYLKLANFDAQWNRVPEINMLSGGAVKCTATVPGMYVYNGITQDAMLLGEEPFHLDAEYLWGHVAQASAFPKNKNTVRIECPAIGYVLDFQTNIVSGFGKTDIDRMELVSNFYSEFVLQHPEPRPTTSVPISFSRQLAHWLGFAFVPDGGAIPSYDVSDSMRHYRSFAQDGTLRVGVSDNAPVQVWTDRDTGIQADSSVLRLERQDKSQRLWLMYSSDAEIKLRSSSDEGATFDAPVSIGTGNLPAMVISRKGLKYLYWVDGENIKGQFRDASGNVVKATFTAIPSVSDVTGLVAGESFEDGGKYIVSLIYATDGTVKYVQSRDGITFS